MFTQKMLAYCANRASGLAQRPAALAAGYLATSAAITASRMECRQDVQTEIARIKKQIKSGKVPPLAPPVVGGDSLPDPASSPLAPWALRPKYANPLELMLDVMNNPKAPIGIRIQASKDAMPYCHARKGESGKKEDAQEAAVRAAGGKKSRFATQSAPLRRVK